MRQKNAIRTISVLSVFFFLFVILYHYYLEQYDVLTVANDSQLQLSSEDIHKICQQYGWPKRDKPGKVYDFFFTNNEAMWWDIRINTLYPYVDGFVIMESNSTFTGKTKPLYFNESMGNFSKFQDKIHHLPLLKNLYSENQWEREIYQTNSLFTEGFKLLDLKENDTILSGDTDEIPKPEKIIALRYCLHPPRLTLQSHLTFYSFEYYGSNTWDLPKAMLYNEKNIPVYTDHRRNPAPIVSNASWHCSYCFEKISDFILKLESFSHQEFNKDDLKDPKKILADYSSGRLYIDNKIMQIIENPDMPPYIKENDDKYHYLYNRHNPTGGFSKEELQKYGL